MADPKGFLTTPRRRRPGARSTCGSGTGARSTSRSPTAGWSSRRARCMDCGIPFCHNGCPLGNLIPEWNDLVWRRRLARGRRAAARDQQLPRVHRAAVPRAVRDRLRARHQRRPGDDQAGRGGDHRPGLGDGLGRRRCRRRALTGRTVAVDRLRPGRAGRRAAADPGRARGDRLRARRRASAACCATASPSSRWRSGTWTGGSTRCGPRAPSSAAACTSGVDITAAQLRAGYDAIVLAGGATVPRGLPVPGARRWTASTRPWSTCRCPTARSRRRRGSSAEPPISARGRHVVIIGGGDTGADCLGTAHRQGAASVTQLEILPRPPEARPASQPWPTYPMIYRVVQRARGGRRAGLRGVHAGVPRRRRRAGCGRCGWSRSSRRRRLRPGAGHRARAAVRPGPAGDGLHRARSGRACSTDLGVEFDAARATWPATARTPPRCPASSSPATWAAASR